MDNHQPTRGPMRPFRKPRRMRKLYKRARP